MVGGGGVRGEASADRDEKLAIAGSNAFASETAMGGDPAPAVSYWEKSQDNEAFSKGAAMFDATDGRNNSVHAYRPPNPGQARIQPTHADLIYVLPQSATS